MLDENLFELFTTVIPQSFGIVLLYFSLLNIKIEKISYSLISISFSLIPFFIRPYVDFGVHSVISMLTLVSIVVLWAKSNIIKSILYSIITFSVAFLTEVIVILFLGIIKYDTSIIETDAKTRAIIGIFPILILFIVAFFVFYKKRKVKKEAYYDIL